MPTRQQGTTTTAAVTPASLRAKLGGETQYLIASGSGSTIALTWLGPLTNGQLLIGSTNAYPVPATLVGTSGIGISQSAQAELSSPAAALSLPLSKIAARPQRRAASSISTARLSKDRGRRPAAIRSHSLISTGRQRKKAWGFCRRMPTRQRGQQQLPPSRQQACAPNSATRQNT